MAIVPNFEGSAQETSGGSSITFSAQPIGTATEHRRVVVGAVGAVGGVLTTRTIVSVTVGGITMTEVIQANSGGINGATAGLFVARVPASVGTTADIVVTYDGTITRDAIMIWSVQGMNHTAALASASGGTSDPASINLTTLADGFVVAVAIQNNGSTYTWTNATERVDTTVDGAGYSGADNNSPGAGTLNVQADYSITDVRCAMVGASWGNALMGGRGDHIMTVHP